jgi:hypothetical protein
MSDGFIRIQTASPPPPETPVLYRAVYAPRKFGRLFVPQEALRTYPAKVLYGGPTYQKYTTTPMFEAFDRGMLLWAMNQGLDLASELVPVAPSAWPPGSSAPAWPHTGWRWWYATETRSKRVYRLAQVTPTKYDWKPAVG